MIKFFSSINNKDHIKLTDRRVYVEELIESGYFLSSLGCLNPGKDNDRLFKREYIKQLFMDSGAFNFRKKPYENPYLDIPTAIHSYKKYSIPGDMLCSPDVIIPDREFLLKKAREFFVISKEGFIPVGVLQGDINDRIHLLKGYLDMGYRSIAQGGIANKAGDKKYILSLLKPILEIQKEQYFDLHMFGISTVPYYRIFKELGGVTSTDSASPYISGIQNGNWLEFDDTRESLVIKKNIREDKIKWNCECKSCRFAREHNINPLTFGNGNGNCLRGMNGFNVLIKAFNFINEGGKIKSNQLCLF